MMWLNIDLSWKITKIRTIPVLVSQPKLVQDPLERGLCFYCRGTCFYCFLSFLKFPVRKLVPRWSEIGLGLAQDFSNIVTSYAQVLQRESAVKHQARVLTGTVKVIYVESKIRQRWQMRRPPGSRTSFPSCSMPRQGGATGRVPRCSAKCRLSAVWCLRRRA